MIYPTITEYIDAIMAAEDNFEELKHLRPVLGNDGKPVMSSGNFAVVFKMKDESDGKLYAIKCFIKEQEGRNESYRLIADELEYVSSTFLTPIRYLEKELFVDSKVSEETEFPVLVMDWVEGVTLDKYIRRHIYDPYELAMLAYQFSRMAMWLMPQPFAHGDLKPDNILVRDDGSLVLVDYDGMYVPAMKGQKARELGSPDFRHPARTDADFDEHIDEFALVSILLSLKAFALQPSLLEEYGAADRLLFSVKDYRNLAESKVLDVLKPLLQDKELTTLLSLFLAAVSQKNLSQVSFRLFYLARPDKTLFPEEELSTEVTDEEIAEGVKDEYGVVYSKDGKRLLKATSEEIDQYEIKKGTRVICDRAFSECSSLTSIVIPDSVTSIGKCAFDGCTSLASIVIPDSVTSIGVCAFSGCTSLASIVILDSVTSIGGCAFFECRSLKSFVIPDSVTSIGESAFYECVSLMSIVIPKSVTSIGNLTFCDCESLVSIVIPDSVTSIGDGVFAGCSNLRKIDVDISNEHYDSRCDCNAIIDSQTNTLIAGCVSTVIPDSVTSIGGSAFYGCSSLGSIVIPDSVTSIGGSAFSGCSSLKSIVIPDSVTSIGDCAFSGCTSLASIVIPDSVTSIENWAFDGCTSLVSIVIPDSVTSIGYWAFSGCTSLASIVIPDSVTSIGDYAFSGCSSLGSIVIPDSVTSIGDEVFDECSSLESIVIPDSVTSIGDGAFSGCTSLASMVIPDSVTSIGDGAFSGCTSLASMVIPANVTSIGYSAFYECRSLESIVIPDSVTSIGYGAFEGCSSLGSIVIPKGTRSKFEKLLPGYNDKLVEQ